MKRRYLYILLLNCFVLITGLCAQPKTWKPTGIGGGGALFSPSINPINENEFYVSCDMSEIFHSSDFGLSYDQYSFKQLWGGNNSTIRFTNNPNLLYSISYADDKVLPVKSIDGGKNWNVLPGNPDATEQTWTINADFNNSNRIIISYYGYIYISNDGGDKFNLIHRAISNGSGVILGGVFFDGNNIYIGTNDGLIVSTDGGTTFETKNIQGIKTGEAIFSFAGAKQNGVTRLFCLTGSSSNLYVGIMGWDYWGLVKGIYSLDYGNGSWTAKLNGLNTSSDYLMYIAMAENDINTVYISGSTSSGNPNIVKTINGGDNWTHIFNTDNNQNIITGWSGDGGDRGWGYSESVFGIAVAPKNTNRLVTTDFGFVHTSTDGGVSWRQAYVSANDQNSAGIKTPAGKNYHSIGIDNTSSWQVLWIDSLNIFSCFSDIKGIRSTDAGSSWSFNYTGNNANTMYRLLKKPGNGYLYAGTSNIHDLYQSTRLADNILDANDPYGKVIYSTDKGASWKDVHFFNHPVFWIALNPNNSNRMYASVVHHTLGGIYVTNNLQDGANSTWTKLANPPRTEGHPAAIVVLNDGNVVCTYSGRRAAAFTASSGVFIYNLTAGTWSDVSDPGMYYWTKDIIIDPDNQNTWYVCVFSGWGGAPNGKGGLYKTTDRGKKWTKINNLDRVTSITFNPEIRNEAYLTTEYQGLWFTVNINQTAPVFNPVSSYLFKQPERVFFNPYKKGEVWVTSFGNGLKVGNSNEANSVNDFYNKKKYNYSLKQNYPNPFNPNTRIEYTLAEDSFIKINIYNNIGQEVAALVDSRKPAGNYTIDWKPYNLPSGVYYYKIEAGNSSSMKKMIYIR